MESTDDARRTSMAGEAFKRIKYEFEFATTIWLLSITTIRYANGVDA